MCGARSLQGQPAPCDAIDLTCSEDWGPNIPDLTLLLIFSINIILYASLSFPSSSSSGGGGAGVRCLSMHVHRLVVVNFWMPWSEPSVQMNEVLDELSQEHEQVTFVKVH